METTLDKLNKWLKTPGNTKVKIAAELGYDCSTVISQWVKRMRMPRHQEARVLEIINRKASRK